MNTGGEHPTNTGKGENVKTSLTFGQLEQYWVKAGGSKAWAPTLAAITYFESGGVPDTIQQGYPAASTGWGLWQITSGTSEPQVGTNYQLLNPLTNAKAALAKFKSQGIGAWREDPAGDASLAQGGTPLTTAQAEALVRNAGYGSELKNVSNYGGLSTTPGTGAPTKATTTTATATTTSLWSSIWGFLNPGLSLGGAAIKGASSFETDALHTAFLAFGIIVVVIGIAITFKGEVEQAAPKAAEAAAA